MNTVISKAYTVKSSAVRAAKSVHPELVQAGLVNFIEIGGLWCYEIVIEEPAVEEPAVEEPAVEEPAVEEPAVEEPAVEEPVIGACAQVWLIAESAHKAASEIGTKPRRSDIIRACINKGINPSTAKTQYQIWFTKNKAL